jgi:signal peptidase I
MKSNSFFKKNLPFFIVVLGLFAFRWSFADQYQVPSGSMEPTIQVGDRIFVNKMAYDLKVPFTNIEVAQVGTPARGDIVVFEYPLDESINYVKRLIGLPGDHIDVVDGFISVNGTEVTGTDAGVKALRMSKGEIATYLEKYGDKTVTVQRTPELFHEQSLSFDVPAGEYFFMGDNRDNSHDSRYWGFATRKELKGRAVAVGWSLRFEHWIPHVDTARFGLTL